MKANQVHFVAAPVFCDSQQIIHAFESRFTGEVSGDVGDGNRRNRINDDVTIVHPVTTTYFDTGTLPDANAASDYPEPDSHAKALGKHHMNLSSLTAFQLRKMRPASIFMPLQDSFKSISFPSPFQPLIHFFCYFTDGTQHNTQSEINQLITGVLIFARTRGAAAYG